MANTYTGSDVGQAGLNVAEEDGAPSVFGVTKINVSDGTLTDNGGGEITITTGGGGGGTPGGTNGQIQFNDNGSFGGVTAVGVANGGTGSTTASGARTSLGAAASGANSDITSLSGLTTPLSVAQGGTGATSLTDGGVLLGSGTGAITATAVFTNGQLLIGDGTGDPTVATLTAGTGITITNGAGSITIAASGGSGTVTSVDTGSNLIGGPITATGTIDLLYDAVTPTTFPPIPVGPEGFVGPPPDDVGKTSYGWARVQTNDPGAPTAYIPLWIDA